MIFVKYSAINVVYLTKNVNTLSRTLHNLMPSFAGDLDSFTFYMSGLNRDAAI